MNSVIYRVFTWGFHRQHILKFEAKSKYSLGWQSRFVLLLFAHGRGFSQVLILFDDGIRFRVHNVAPTRCENSHGRSALTRCDDERDMQIWATSKSRRGKKVHTGASRCPVRISSYRVQLLHVEQPSIHINTGPSVWYLILWTFANLKSFSFSLWKTTEIQNIWSWQ